MKNVVIASVVLLGLTTPSYAWYDSYGTQTTMAVPKQPVYNTQQLYQTLPPRPVPVQRPMPVPVIPYDFFGGPYLPCLPQNGCGPIY